MYKRLYICTVRTTTLSIVFRLVDRGTLQEKIESIHYILRLLKHPYINPPRCHRLPT
jgi:hypothetical protein